MSSWYLLWNLPQELLSVVTSSLLHHCSMALALLQNDSVQDVTPVQQEMRPISVNEEYRLPGVYMGDQIISNSLPYQ